MHILLLPSVSQFICSVFLSQANIPLSICSFRHDFTIIIVCIQVHTAQAHDSVHSTRGRPNAKQNQQVIDMLGYPIIDSIPRTVQSRPLSFITYDSFHSATTTQPLRTSAKGPTADTPTSSLTRDDILSFIKSPPFVSLNQALASPLFKDNGLMNLDVQAPHWAIVTPRYNHPILISPSLTT